MRGLMRIGLIVTVLLSAVVESRRTRIHIALLTNYNQTQPYKEVIEFAVTYVNQNPRYLPDHSLRVYHDSYSPNPASVVKSACDMIQNGVTAIVTDGSSTIVGLQGDTLAPYNIPLYSLQATDPFLTSNQRAFLIRSLPSDSYQSQALFQLLKENEWKQFSILTSSNAYGMNGMLELERLAMTELFGIDSIQHFLLPIEPSQLNVTHELSVIKEALSQIVVLHADGKYAKYILEQAMEMGMLGKGYAWILTDSVTGNPGVLQTEDGYLPSYYTGLLGTRPLYSAGPFYEEFMKNFTKDNPGVMIGDAYALSAFDAVLVLAEMLTKYLADGNTLQEQSLTCLTQFNSNTIVDRFRNGTAIMEYLDDVNIMGIGNQLEFQEDKGPKHVQYDIVNFRDNTFVHVGKWNAADKENLTLKEIVYLGGGIDSPDQRIGSLKGFNFTFGVMESRPFIIEDTETNCTGNACFTGYCVDLVEELAKDLGFNYTFVKPPDNKFGGLDADGETWNGNIKELLENRIDMITTDMSVNSLRTKAIDFTQSFKAASIQAVLKAGTAKQNKKFFLSPFSTEVWYSILIANCFCALFLCFVTKVSPYGFYGGKMYALLACKCSNCVANRKLTAGGFKPLTRDAHFQCLLEELECENEDTLDKISLYNSFWMISTGLFGQSGESHPYCAPGRFVIMGWWFFMMIMSAMYTANLAAALTVKNINNAIGSAEELLEQDDYAWGTINSAHPKLLLQYSINEKYNALIEKGHHVDNIGEGMEYMRNGFNGKPYVLIYEKPVLDYMMTENCDITYAGDDFQQFEYAFGIAKLSPFTPIINARMLTYMENGFLNSLWVKWGTSAKCDQKSSMNSVTLDMDSLGGIFMALAASMVVALMLVVCEFIYASGLDVYGNKHRLTSDGKRDSAPPFEGKFLGALTVRLKILAYDFMNYWLSFESFKQVGGEKKDTLQGELGGGPKRKPSQFNQEAFTAAGKNMIASGGGMTAGGRWNVVSKAVQKGFGSPISGYH
uniref:ANF_receptor domain-containing protein n=1 Tax=Euplokamis dunlapae TaxID=1403701 RepID=V9PPS5_9METZ|nr:ANF_receptor domain-containing protein [Euplokamis dunlapae]AQX17744.1 ionotropic glutamate receptor [Euplokamis dunlapae]